MLWLSSGDNDSKRICCVKIKTIRYLSFSVQYSDYMKYLFLLSDYFVVSELAFAFSFKPPMI